MGYVGREGSAFVFEVGGEDDPARFLASMGISKAESGRIRAQGRIRYDAQAGTFAITPLADAAPAPETLKAPEAPAVLYEDDFALAVAKPAGVLVHGDGTGAPSLSDAVAAYLAAKGELASPQAVQRLDVDTTGIVLFSKAAEFQGLFDALVADHSLMTKRYLAVVEGAYPAAHDRIALQVARDRHDARRMRACDRGGQDALTLVERLAVAPGGKASLLQVTLGTGRRHQIRVHLAHRGFPIAGDPLYGPRRPGLEVPGLMLHAWRERFTHPVTDGAVSIECPYPDYFYRLFTDTLTAIIPW